MPPPRWGCSTGASSGPRAPHWPTSSTGRPDAVVDFWNPFAVMAARWRGVPVVTVIQADAHPSSGGSPGGRRRRPPTSPVPTVNDVLAELGLPAVRTVRDLSVGERTLVVGTPRPIPCRTAPTSSTWARSCGSRRARACRSRSPRSAGSARWRGCTRATPATGAARALDSEVVLEPAAALGAQDLDVVVTAGHRAAARAGPAAPQRAPRALRPRTGHGPALRPDDPPGGYGSRQTLVGGTPSVIVPTYSGASNARRMEAAGARCWSRSRGRPGQAGRPRPPGPGGGPRSQRTAPTGSGPASSGGDSTSWGAPPRCGPDPRGRLTAGRLWSGRPAP